METDPNGTDQHEGGAKLDAGKTQADLLQDMGLALMEVAELGTIGAVKYSRGGWLKVPDGIRRYTGAMMRHFLKEPYQAVDDDTGVLHATAVAWNSLARLELILRKEQDATQ